VAQRLKRGGIEVKTAPQRLIRHPTLPFKQVNRTAQRFVNGHVRFTSDQPFVIVPITRSSYAHGSVRISKHGTQLHSYSSGEIPLLRQGFGAELRLLSTLAQAAATWQARVESASRLAEHMNPARQLISLDITTGI
jgi:hypothetical protein